MSIIETFGFVHIALGMFGDLSSEARDRIASIEGTLALRKEQLASAIETNSEKVDVYRRTVKSLEEAIGGIRLEAQELGEQGVSIALTGVVVLVAAKIVQSIMANTFLEARYSDWLSDQSIPSGMPVKHIVLSTVFAVFIVIAAMMHYSFPGTYPLLSNFPTDPNIRLTSIKWVETFFTFAVTNGDALFDFITYGIIAEDT